MRKKLYLFILLGILFITTSCNQSQIREIVKNNIILFEENFPQELIDTLSDNKIVVVGEYHDIKDHRDLVTELAITLNRESEFKLFLTETPHGVSWMLEDYCLGEFSKTSDLFEFIKGNSQVDLDKIREYNDSLPKNQRIKVKGVDINHHPAYLIKSLAFINEEKILKETDILQEFLQNIEKKSQDDDFEAELKKEILSLQRKLNLEKEKYISLWGNKWYQRITEMVEIEKLSIQCRQELEEENYSERTIIRENIMKELVDEYLKNENNRVIFNIGANHAQKKALRGTKHEWVTEYLQNRSPYANNSTYSLLVVPAKGRIRWGSIGNNREIDISKGRGKNELFKIMNSYAKDKHSFLPLDDKIFSIKKDIPMNFHFETVYTAPKELYDGIIMLPEASVYQRILE